MGLIYDPILGKIRKRDETTAIGGGAVTYDNSISGLTATNVQEAIDELDATLDTLDQVFILQGTWDASSGVFPGGGTAQAGYIWIVSVTGTVDGVEFTANQDHIIALVDNASTTTYSGDWYKSDGSASTNLTEGTATTTTVDVNSDTGANATLNEATSLRAGVMSSAKFDEVGANTLKPGNATHTGEVSGSGALTAQPTIISNKTTLGSLSGTEEFLINDGGVLKKVLASNVGGGNSIYTADDTIGAGRVATLTDSLTFDGGTTILKGLNKLGTSDALLVQDSDSQSLLQVANTGATTIRNNNGTLLFNITNTAIASFNGPVDISGGIGEPTLKVKSIFATSGTTALLVQDGAGTPNDLLKVLDDGTTTIDGITTIIGKSDLFNEYTFIAKNNSANDMFKVSNIGILSTRGNPISLQNNSSHTFRASNSNINRGIAGFYDGSDNLRFAVGTSGSAINRLPVDNVPFVSQQLTATGKGFLHYDNGGVVYFAHSNEYTGNDNRFSFGRTLTVATSATDGIINIAPSTTTSAHIKLDAGVSPTGTNLTNGAMWYNGTELNFRSGGVTTDLLSPSVAVGDGGVYGGSGSLSVDTTVSMGTRELIFTSNSATYTKLQLNNTQTSGASQFEMVGSDGAYSQKINYNPTVSGGWLTNSFGDLYYNRIYNLAFQGFGNTSTNVWQIKTTPTASISGHVTRMLMNGNGEFNIGQNNPVSGVKLRVEGQTIVKGINQLGTSTALLVEDSIGTDLLKVANDGSTTINGGTIIKGATDLTDSVLELKNNSGITKWAFQDRGALVANGTFFEFTAETATNSYFKITTNSTLDNLPSLEVTNNATTASRKLLSLKNGATELLQFYSNGTFSSLQGFNNAGSLEWALGASATYVLALTSGNVGIGVGSPTAKLHVNGSTLLNGNLGVFGTTPIAQPTTAIVAPSPVGGGGTTTTDTDTYEGYTMSQVVKALRNLGILA